MLVGLREGEGERYGSKEKFNESKINRSILQHATRGACQVHQFRCCCACKVKGPVDARLLSLRAYSDHCLPSLCFRI